MESIKIVNSNKVKHKQEKCMTRDLLNCCYFMNEAFLDTSPLGEYLSGYVSRRAAVFHFVEWQTDSFWQVLVCWDVSLLDGKQQI